MNHFKIAVIVVCMFSLLGCKKDRGKGTVKGNVYWRYNDFVGDKPDAGASVALYDFKDSNTIYRQETDLRGDYEFKDIPAGAYLLIIRSKNTTASAGDNITELYFAGYELDTFFRTNVKEVLEKKIWQLHRYDSLSSEYVRADNNPLQFIYRDSAEIVSKEMIDELPEKVKRATFVLGPGSNKVRVELIRVAKDQTTSKVTDFGITYM
jgi:hypothetical protein